MPLNSITAQPHAVSVQSVHTNPMNNTSRIVQRLAIALFVFSFAAFVVLFILPERTSTAIQLREGDGGAAAASLTSAGIVFTAVFGKRNASHQPEHRNIHRRALCSGVPAGIALGDELLPIYDNFVASGIAEGLDGSYFQAWATTGGSLKYRKLNPSLVPGTTRTSPWSFSPLDFRVVSVPDGSFGVYSKQLYPLAGPNNYMVSSNLFGTDGGLVNFHDYIMGAFPFSISTSSSSTGFYSLNDDSTFVWHFPTGAGGGPTGIPIVNNTLMASAPYRTDTGQYDVVVWNGSPGLYGRITSGNGGITPFTTLNPSILSSGLACAQLRNGNVVVVWINSNNNLAEFQFFDPSLHAIPGVIQIDLCSPGAQSSPTVIPYQGGFIVGLTDNGMNFGYRFDVNGNLVDAKFPFTSSLSGSRGPISLAPYKATSIYAVYTAGGNALSSQVFSIKQHPYLTANIPPQSVFAGSPYALNLTGLIEDEEGPLTITLTPLPTWANFDPLQLYLSGTPLSPDRKSTNLTFTGQNQLGDSVSTTFTLTVLNNKPTVNGTFPSYQIFVGQLLNVTIPNIFDDRDGDLITVSLVPPYPAGINYSNATRNLWWTPRSGAQGANNLTFVGSDGQEEASAPLTINVPNRPPVFNEALPSFHIPVGKLFTYQVIPNATDPDEDPLVYDINSTKFNQVFTLSINPPVSYCPNGVVNYLVKVLDPFGGVGTTNFNITFFSEPPAITTPIPPLGAIVNTFLYYPIPANTFTTVPGMALTYQTEIGENSTWLSLSNGILSGTPNEPGLTLLNVTAIDACGTRSSPTQLRITVSANGAGGNPPQVNAPILSFSKLSGEVFTFQIPANAFVDPNGGNLTYLATQIDGNPLYPWLFFNSATGAFIGNPAVTDVGNFGVLVRALNSQGVVSQPQWFTIILLDSNLPPIISKAPLPPAAYAEAFYSFYFGDVFTNPNGGSVETTAQCVAEWIQVNNETLLGTPWHQDVGSVTVTLTGVNARGLKAVTSFVLPVQGDNMYIYLTKIIGSVFTVISGLALAYKAYRSRVMLKQKGLQCITTLRGFRFSRISLRRHNHPPLLMATSNPYVPLRELGNEQENQQV